MSSSALKTATTNDNVTNPRSHIGKLPIEGVRDSWESSNLERPLGQIQREMMGIRTRCELRRLTADNESNRETTWQQISSPFKGEPKVFPRR